MTVSRSQLRQVPGSICAPRGYRCAAVFCDIKKLGTGLGSEKGRKDDLALIVSDVPAMAAAMFTTNQVSAAPVKVSAKHVGKGKARAVVINSGNANACTGKQGLRDAERMTQIAASSLAAVYDRRDQSDSAVIDRRYKNVTAPDVLVCSTGRIGVPMPMRNLERGIKACAPLLARSPVSARAVAQAIMTSDTRRKEIAVEFKIRGTSVRIGGICKGAGMIQPGMATMLALITTDAAIGLTDLKSALKTAVGQSFNRITVDGDMSTNDSVILLANELAGNARIESRKPDFEIFQNALNFVCLELAKMIVRDGEGVSRFVTLRVRGARNDRDAELVARSIANSSLVRTSWCGGDPNWGRILCAAGYAKAKVREELAEIGYGQTGKHAVTWAFRRGLPTKVPFAALTKITSEKEFDVHVHLHLGHGEYVMYATDLTEDYVTFNKGDITDPASLGG